MGLMLVGAGIMLVGVVFGAAIQAAGQKQGTVVNNNGDS